MRRIFNGALVAIAVSAIAAVPALARGNDLSFTDGQGETVSIRHGFFGRGQSVVKDRLGDGYSSSTGFFGSKEQQASILGNNFQRKKGILGNTSVSGGTIFGDRITTKKGIFGRRTTAIDVSGTSNVLKSLWQSKGSQFLGGNMGGDPGFKRPTPLPNTNIDPGPNPSVDPGPIVPQGAF